MIDFRDNVREAVVFGALLHDIGKMMHKDCLRNLPGIG